MALSRRNFLTLAGALGLSPALAACGGAGSRAGGLEFWSTFPNDEARAYFQRARIDAFQGGDVRLSVKPIDSIDRLMQTALAAGSGPDLIVTAGPAQVAAYAGAGYLSELDAYAEQYGWAEALAPWAVAASKVDGKLLSMPNNYETMIMMFNPATLEDNGWTVPTTRADFEAICTEAKAKGLMPVAAGNADFRPATEWHLTVGLNHIAGPEAVHSALTGETPWTDPVFVDAFSQLNDYYQKGWWGGSTENYFTNTFPTLFDNLATGQAVFMITGSWSLTEIGPYFGEAAGNDAEWDWAPLPSLSDTVPEQVWDLAIGQTLSVNAASSDKDVAAEFLDFLITGPERQAEGIAEVGLQPAPIRLEAGDFPAEVDERQARLYTELTNASSIGYTTWTFFPQESNVYLYTDFDKVVVGDVDVAAFTAGLDEVFAAELAAGKVPEAPVPGGVA